MKTARLHAIVVALSVALGVALSSALSAQQRGDSARDTSRNSVGLPPARVAQDTAPPMTAGDSELVKAKELVTQGKTAEARALVQSVLSTAPPQSMTYASALYARASLATNADSAERDYRRITVEFSESPRAPDALLRLAQLELARGNRDQASAHLAKLTREMPPGQTGVAYARTQLQIGLAYMDLQDATKACTALAAASAAVPATDIELKNRIDYNAQRCPPAGAPGAANAGAKAAVATAPATAKPTKTSASAPPKSAGAAAAGASAAAASTTGAAAASASAPAVKAAPSVTATVTAATPAAASASTRARGPEYTVQVAAYQTMQPAQALAEQLKDRGYPVRVFGVAAPFRVRIGRYPTEAQADSVARALKAKGQVGFVTAAEPLTP